MTKKITELDKAQLRHEARELFLDHGFQGLIDAIERTIAVSEAIIEVAREEYQRCVSDEHRQDN